MSTDTFTIDRMANSGTPMEIAGKTWFVTQVTLNEYGRLQAIIKMLQPKPFEVAKEAARGLPPDLAIPVLNSGRKDQEFWPAPVASSQGLQILFNSREGQRELLKVCLGRAQECKEEDIEHIMQTLGYVEFMKIAAVAISGEDPVDDPKE